MNTNTDTYDQRIWIDFRSFSLGVLLPDASAESWTHVSNNSPNPEIPNPYELPFIDKTIVFIGSFCLSTMHVFESATWLDHVASMEGTTVEDVTPSTELVFRGLLGPLPLKTLNSPPVEPCIVSALISLGDWVTTFRLILGQSDIDLKEVAVELRKFVCFKAHSPALIVSAPTRMDYISKTRQVQGVPLDGS
jgi:hypothetical protein